MFTKIEWCWLGLCLIGGVIGLRATNKALDRWSDNMKQEIAIIEAKTKLAQELYEKGGEK